MATTFEEGRPITFTIGPDIKFLFPYLFEKRQNDLGEDAYEVNLLIPYTNQKAIDLINDAIDEAIDRGYDPATPETYRFKPNTPEDKLFIPLKDGVNETGSYADVYKDHMYIKAKSQRRPGVFDCNCQQILDPERLFSGCKGAASITLSSFNNVQQGVTVYVNHVMILDDSERIGGTVSAEEAFADYVGSAAPAPIESRRRPTGAQPSTPARGGRLSRQRPQSDILDFE